MSFVGVSALLIITALACAVRFCIVFPRQPFAGPLPPLEGAHRTLALSLEAHVRAVASRPHNLDHPVALEAAARHIEATLTGLGYTPFAQRFMVGRHEVRNIEIVIEPAAGAVPLPGTLVVGAHYDSPDDSPGANDNGTGVAALLELAARLRDLLPVRRVRLVFFVNEEQPYGKTPDMGSYRHAQDMRTRGEPVMGMLALETLGHFPDRPGTQRFPFPFGLIYPDRGNFVAFVGMPCGRAFVHACVSSFRAVAPVPSIGGVAPGFIEGIDLSDHWAYDHFGYPACMVTDTAPFRNPFYHSPHDLPDTVDYAGLARVTVGLEAMIRRLASR
jgi:Peptidase family M28